MSDTAQWITLATVVIGFVVQYLRENRQRQWDKEDRAELALKVVAEAAKVKAHIESKSAGLAGQIAENTDISTKAFHEANSVNLKIASLGLEHNAMQRKEQGKK